MCFYFLQKNERTVSEHHVVGVTGSPLLLPQIAEQPLFGLIHLLPPPSSPGFCPVSSTAYMSYQEKAVANQLGLSWMFLP